ncbi:hypothetical protein FML11_02405 [Klebsiella oxytoca]|nr:hypothetical protein [Klebsiella oxytoca]
MSKRGTVYGNTGLGGHRDGVPGRGDATAPTDSAERDYFTLRERIVTITGQVSYLQDYIRTKCLR